jgi:hypothetical protein
MNRIDILLRAYDHEFNQEERYFLLQELEDEITKEKERLEHDMAVENYKPTPIIIDYTRF